MKCLSLWQPWASLIAIGAKTLETRSWETMYRGELAIHAAQKWTRELGQIAASEPFVSALAEAGLDQTWIKKLCANRSPTAKKMIPLGAILCTAKLVDCYRIDPLTAPLDARELAFGDYTTGRFAWVLEDVRPLANPIPFKGRPGLFNVPASLLKVVEVTP